MADPIVKPDPNLDETVRGRLAYATYVYSAVLLGTILYMELHIDWNLSPFAQSVILLIAKHAIDNVGSMLQFYWGSSWGSAMKSIIMGRPVAPVVTTTTTDDPKKTTTTVGAPPPPTEEPKP